MDTLSRRAINFDLNDYLLKKNYPSTRSYKNAWNDIRIFLEKRNFVHRQYSGYVSKVGMTMVDVGNAVVAMSFEFDWLKPCVMEFDVTKSIVLNKILF